MKKIVVFKVFFLVSLLAFFLYMMSDYAVVKMVRVEGNSMHPTLEDGQILTLQKQTRTIQRGDVVVFKSPRTWFGKPKNLIKRVVAVPGDTIKIKNKELFVNDVFAFDLEVQYGGAAKDDEFCLCNGGYFVVGDNYQNSYDSLSRYYTYKDFTDTADFLVPDESILYYTTIEKVSDEE